MKLTFTSGAVTVDEKTTITRRLLTQTAEAVATLRKAGQNTALNNALAANPGAIAYLGGSWLGDKRRAIQEAYPNAGEQFIAGEVQKALAAAMTEEFPAVWQAMLNPTTEVDFQNDESVTAAFALCRSILDTTKLDERQATELDADGFWDEQDLEEVAGAVARFRDRAKL